MEPEWIQEMQEELQQFELNNVWELVKHPDPRKHNIIGITTNKMSMVKLSEAKLVSLLKDILKLKGLTLMKHLLLWLDLKPYAYCWPMQIIIPYSYIKWM